MQQTQSEITYIVPYRCPNCQAGLEARTSEANFGSAARTAGVRACRRNRRERLASNRFCRGDDVLVDRPGDGCPRPIFQRTDWLSSILPRAAPVLLTSFPALVALVARDGPLHRELREGGGRRRNHDPPVVDHGHDGPTALSGPPSIRFDRFGSIRLGAGGPGRDQGLGLPRRCIVFGLVAEPLGGLVQRPAHPRLLDIPLATRKSRSSTSASIAPSKSRTRSPLESQVPATSRRGGLSGRFSPAWIQPSRRAINVMSNELARLRPSRSPISLVAP